LTSFPSFSQVKGIDIPIKSIPATNPPKMLDELEDVFESESEDCPPSESEDDPLLDEPPSKSSISEADDSTSASASSSTKFLP
jgi:hypothetical protein